MYNNSSQNLSLELRNAAAKGEVKKVNELLNKYANTDMLDIDARSSNGNTALIWAMQKRAILRKQNSRSTKIKDYNKIIYSLLESGADDMLYNNDKQSAYQEFFNSNIQFDLDNADLLYNMCYITVKREFVNEDMVLGGLCTLYARLLSQLFTLDVHHYVTDLTTVKVLSLACGISVDALAFNKYLKLLQKELIYVGVDIDPTLLNDFYERFGKRENIGLLLADATDVAKLQEKLGHDKYDFGILSNGDFTSSVEQGREKVFLHLIDSTFPELVQHQAPILMTFGSTHELMTFRNNSQAYSEKYIIKSRSGNYSARVFSDNGVFATDNCTLTKPNTHAIIMRYNLENHKKLRVSVSPMPTS